MNLKFVSNTAVAFVLVTFATSLPVHIKRAVDPILVPEFGVQRNHIPLVNAKLVPDLGHQAGLNPDGHGNCDGITSAQGQIIKVPCACPPDRSSFIQALSENVAAGSAVHNPSVAVSFPTDQSKSSLATRIEAAIITLQNLKGPGIGCPASSTTLSVQLKAAQG